MLEIAAIVKEFEHKGLCTNQDLYEMRLLSEGIGDLAAVNDLLERLGRLLDIGQGIARKTIH